MRQCCYKNEGLVTFQMERRPRYMYDCSMTLKRIRWVLNGLCSVVYAFAFKLLALRVMVATTRRLDVHSSHWDYPAS